MTNVRARSTRTVSVALACACSLLFFSFGAVSCLVSIDDALADRDGGGASDAIASDSPFDGTSTDANGNGDGAIGDAGASDSSADARDSGAESGPPACPSGMVRVPRVNGGGADYCVDPTETTAAQYASFLANAPAPTTANQRAECAWNTSWVPAGWDGGAPVSSPVLGVDWCDAVGFCAFAKKHLCGKIGGGGPVDSPSRAVYDAGQGEWFNACSKGGTRTYPYGATYDPQACNGVDFGAPHVNDAQNVGSLAACNGGFAGLFDMSGNAQEWLDSCEVPVPRLPQCTTNGPECDLCRSGGGGYGSPQARLGCGTGDELLRSAQYGDTGFRCCADMR